LKYKRGGGGKGAFREVSGGGVHARPFKWGSFSIRHFYWVGRGSDRDRKKQERSEEGRRRGEKESIHPLEKSEKKGVFLLVKLFNPLGTSS